MSENRQTYAQKLRDPRWQKRRLEMLEREGWACNLCCDTETTLHVHHLRYVKGREPWQYSDDELQVLCENCHAEHHQFETVLQFVFSSANPIGRDYAGFIAGHASFSHSAPWADELGAFSTPRDVAFGVLLGYMTVARIRDPEVGGRVLQAIGRIEGLSDEAWAFVQGAAAQTCAKGYQG